MARTRVGTIKELWRFPVKSLGGERRRELELERRGAVGDRLWAVRDLERGELTSAKKLPRLMLIEARYLEEPRAGEAPRRVPPVELRFPDGRHVRSGDADLDRHLSDFVGRRVALTSLAPARDGAHYHANQANQRSLRELFGVAPSESLPDLSTLPLALLAELSFSATPRGTYFDAFPLHVLTTASLAAMRALAPACEFDVRRFRPNLLIETPGRAEPVELGWCGGSLEAGTLRASVVTPTVRCAMPTRPQPGLAAEPRIIKTIAAHAERCLGVYARVARPGRVALGDSVEVVPPSDALAARLARAAWRRGKRRLVQGLTALLPRG
ncbi:MAG: MOSC N-terminal beta barrel domain-containing protein [Sorangiineae bacterium]|nr:MOSC N-terminal beta barrel domain-containing protein [Polyangiaceae bacterium]MEB2321321.1 MOSC N-terminal beta barrel domain-containing protein [Sorangiineae bacterium]